MPINSRDWEKMLALDSFSRRPQQRSTVPRKIISRKVSRLHLYADLLDATAYTDRAPCYFRGYLAHLKFDALEDEYTACVHEIPGLYARGRTPTAALKGLHEAYEAHVGPLGDSSDTLASEPS